MAKTIKFNLILDGEPVRDIEGLREHFSIEDMLKYYHNGLLLRWLEIREYDEQYNKVKDINNSDSDQEILKELVQIFSIKQISDADIKKVIEVLKDFEIEKQKSAVFEKNKAGRKKVVEDYYKGYEALVCHMESSKDDMSILQADARKMLREYLELFQLNYYGLYLRLCASAPKAVFAMLTIDEFREIWANEKADGLRDGREVYSIYNDLVCIDTNRQLLGKDLKKILGKDLKIVKGRTQYNGWIRLEERGKTFMVVSCPREYGYVKNAGESSEGVNGDEIKAQFPRYNGLDYRCIVGNSELLYLEVL